MDPFAKVVIRMEKKKIDVTPASLYLVPYPQIWAMVVVVPRHYPAQTGGRMSEGQEWGIQRKA
jgi:hypothetical protein